MILAFSLFIYKCTFKKNFKQKFKTKIQFKKYIFKLRKRKKNNKIAKLPNANRIGRKYKKYF